MDLGPSACEAIPLSRMGSVSLQSAGIQKLSTKGLFGMSEWGMEMNILFPFLFLSR